MPKVALIETKPSKTNFRQEFDGAFEFDQFQLCSNPTIKKVLKKDCDIEIDSSLYDWIILVGSDALKFFTKINSVTEYSGKVVEQKFLPVINPAPNPFSVNIECNSSASRFLLTKIIHCVTEIVSNKSINVSIL